MIPNFRTFLKESVWMDIHKRSVGDTDRKEENVNLLDFDGLYDYIESNYSLSDEDTLTICHNGPKPVGICVLFGSYSANNIDYDFYIDYKKNDVNGKSEITFYKYLEEKWGDLIQKLKDKFVLVDCGHNIFGETTSAISILPQSGNVDNKFFIEVVDFISQNTTSYIKKK